ncbi:RAD52 motif-containing protein 1 [Bombina bombina]|uniref:RAD52 motif-containing protein 1 n=1 Tax=Bombina bombina TaxID=8345 RepID=UPI00235A7395|nr:RAD52 motif-containing protein 1 [Bombina bombina]
MEDGVGGWKRVKGSRRILLRASERGQALVQGLRAALAPALSQQVQCSHRETCSLLKVFSQFGALYSLRLLPNAGIADPGYYAVAKFYSSRDAARAQVACDKKSLFQHFPLKVRVCNKQKGFQNKFLALSSNKCQDLANHYLGFNGWSKRIIALQNISGFDEQDDEGLEQNKLKYLCVLEVMFPNHGIRSRGVGVAEEVLEKSNDPLEPLVKTGKLQKYAVQKALSDAFQKILLLIFDNGKVAVEHVLSEDNAVECLTEEELQGLIQVNDFTWTHMTQEGEEEDLSEMTFHEESFADRK